MLPKSKIVISKNGDHRIEGLEKTDSCHKLSEMGAAAGKVVGDKEKDHEDVFQSVHLKGE